LESAAAPSSPLESRGIGRLSCCSHRNRNTCGLYHCPRCVGPAKTLQPVVVDDDEITDLRRQFAAMTAERDQALADVRFITLAKNCWRQIVMASYPVLSPKEQNT
jgi:hypothetical protein